MRVCGLVQRVYSQSLHTTPSVTGFRPRLQILPSWKSLFDEPLQIKVDGLIPKQRVELRGKLTDDRGVLFKSSATYSADSSGTVDLGTSSSLGGSYTGVEPMGLFWSMTPEKPSSRLLIKDASSPVLVNIEVINGSDLGDVLASETVERGFMAEGTRRSPVNVGRIRGNLFIPPGPGPFPGVLDLYTFGGGLTEVRGSLLANKGFVVLCLAYYNYADLPKSVSHFDLEYFEEALMFLRSQPEVRGPGVGIISISKGAALALSIASFLPGVSATVWINGCNANVMLPLHYKDMIIPPLIPDFSKITFAKPGILDVRDSVTDPMAEGNRSTVIPIERANCRFLFVASEDDRNWNSCCFADQAAMQLKVHGKDNFEVIKYPRAGHFLEVPYMPHYPFGFHPVVGKVVAYGGDARCHADAHLDLWRRIQLFFYEHLVTGSNKTM